MPIWKPDIRVDSNRALELNRGNSLVWKYVLDRGNVFPPGTTAAVTLQNTYGQVLGTWAGLVEGGTITITQPVEVCDAIPAGASWTLVAIYGGSTPRLLTQGTVIRVEAPFPDAPAQSAEFEGVVYQYSFATPGYLVDPNWRVLQGVPRVYDNSARQLPNSVAAGSLLAGDQQPYASVAMLYYAPLKTDAVRLTYNTIRTATHGNGEALAIICSSYDMSNWVGFRHRQVFDLSANGWLRDTVEIVTGTGPTAFVTRQTIEADTGNNQNYTAEYNPSSDTYALYLGTSKTPLISWPDTTKLISHGPGEQHVGFGFKSDFAEAGVGVSDWIIADTP